MSEFKAQAIKAFDERLKNVGLKQHRAPTGVFGPHPATTPKYSRMHTGDFRADYYTESMARLFVQVGPAEYAHFLKSVQASGDPASVELARVLAGSNLGIGSDGGGAGYVDFLLQQAQHSFQEKREVVELLGDNRVVYYFGSVAPVFSYGGVLINSKQDDQAHNMYRIYRDMIRGTQLARRRKVVALRYDNMIVRGTTDGLSWSLGSDNEMLCPFQFQVTVASVILMQNPDWGVVPLSEPFSGSLQDGVIRGSLLPTLPPGVVQTRDAAIRVTLAPPSPSSGNAREQLEQVSVFSPVIELSEEAAVTIYTPSTMPDSTESVPISVTTFGSTWRR